MKEPKVCVRCGGVPHRNKTLCRACLEYVAETWPGGATPLADAEPWMVQLAISNQRKARSMFEVLVQECAVHFADHDACPEYCVGAVTTRIINSMSEGTVRMVVLAAVRRMGHEIYRNDKVGP